MVRPRDKPRIIGKVSERQMIEAAVLVIKDHYITPAANAREVLSKLCIDMLRKRNQIEKETLKCSHIMMFVKYLLKNKSMILLTVSVL
jgi:hypothetical protein